MKLIPLWILLAFIPIAGAEVVTCNAGAASVPVFNPSSVSGAVGEYTLDCTGGTPVVPPDAIPVVNFDAFMNVPILNTGGWILSDGVNMTPGTLVGSNEIEFVGVPFDPPGTGNTVFTVENILVDPNFVPPGFQFMEESEITGDTAVEISLPQQLVAVNAVPEPSMLGFLGVCLAAIRLRKPD
jgi:hypothetical protein